MTFEELGATLKTEREKQNLNIDDLANRLKIPARQLRALENGDTSSLPPPAYVKGFIRSYATALGIGVKEIQDAINEISGVPPTPKNETSSGKSAPKRGGGRVGLALFVLLCLLAGAYYSWDAGYFDAFLKGSGTGESTAVLQSADAAMAAKDAAREAAAKETARAKAERAASAEAEAQAAETEKPTAPVEKPVFADGPKTEAAPVVAAVEETPSEAPAETVVPGQRGQHKLIITAVEECWVHSNTDKSDTRQFSLRKGDTFALPFAESLELKLGNAGGVRLRYDGVDLPPPGTSGQVKTLVFPPKEN